jgi:hypothetical protein
MEKKMTTEAARQEDIRWARIEQGFSSLSESHKRLDKSMDDLRESQKETDRIVQNLAWQIGGDNIDKTIEVLMTLLTKKFREKGYNFTRAARDLVIEYPDGRTPAEVAVFVENGDYALAVDVKAPPKIQDVKAHERRMRLLRTYANDRGDKRKYIGAIAAPDFYKPSVREAAFRAGFFVIEASENAVNIAFPQGFKPKEW